jgi:exodeoxyribonuclease-5
MTPTPEQLSRDQETAIMLSKDWFLNQTGSTFYMGGYAGTGKTKIAGLLAQYAKKPVFGAYTGRAALQLERKSGFPASTLHSLLYKPRTVNGQVTFVFDPEESPLWDTDLLIIDEASMVPDAMEKDLLHFKCRILLIGDPAQLPPPMKSGGLLQGRKPDAMLTEIHRQAKDSPVLRLATAVREGKGLPQGRFGNSCVMNSKDPVKQAVESKASMVLAGMKKTVRKLNIAFRGGDESLPRAGEPLLALQNQRESGIMNGSLWKLEGFGRGGMEVFDEGDLAMIDGIQETPNPVSELFPHRFWVSLHEEPDRRLSNILVDFSPAMGQEYQYARGVCPMDFGYCLTVHKSQGSEWPEVCLINESGVFKDASRQWLYTGLTRAGENVLVLNGRV